MSLRIAILASGNGSNAQRLFDLSRCGALDAEPALLICNRPGARVLERAALAGVPSVLLDHDREPDRERYDNALIDALLKAEADLIVMAGYMRLVTPRFLRSFPERVINVHPALLPAFPGLRGAKDALEYGARISGCTVHFVDEQPDHGPIIIQAAVPVETDDDARTLQERIHEMEHRIYPQAVQWFAEGRVRLNGRRVRILPNPARKIAVPGEGRLVRPPLEEPF
jgi:phosphoribosylglycinamide formyltransferase-1